ncbi:carbon-nitrogen family hydrolase [Neobacillus sp. PS3-12]|uniref:carbon-nitrogen family hydrolase n=1 Tax=Neobacillus sp. PS3-12 TaxID=3070677 RepID=UPI0027DF184E|nr:carbon-nitrogen family hydrolase [Neobacillus sp. PS3-12]WML55151.1 carbon-nitrogen family hydrolase [Neobacillus sp. PS3-12]
MKIAVCQMEIIQGDKNINRVTAERMITEAAQNGAQVVVLPEMWTSGYDFAQLDQHKEPLEGSTYQFLSEIAGKQNVWVVGGSHPVEFPEGVRNTTLTFNPKGELQNIYSKVHLIGLMAEDQYLVPGTDCHVFDLDGHLAAVEICYDIRFPELARSYAVEGAKILFIPAEWPIQREDHWVALLRARAIENQMFVVGVNTSGKNENDVFNGHSMIIDPWGKTIAEAGSDSTILYCDVDLDLVTSVRERMPVFKDRRPSVYKL